MLPYFYLSLSLSLFLSLSVCLSVSWYIYMYICCCFSLVAEMYQTPCDTEDCRTPTRLLCPWDFGCKNTGVGCHFLFQGIFPTRNPHICMYVCIYIYTCIYIYIYIHTHTHTHTYSQRSSWGRSSLEMMGQHEKCITVFSFFPVVLQENSCSVHSLSSSRTSFHRISWFLSVLCEKLRLSLPICWKPQSWACISKEDGVCEKSNDWILYLNVSGWPVSITVFWAFI